MGEQQPSGLPETLALQGVAEVVMVVAVTEEQSQLGLSFVTGEQRKELFQLLFLSRPAGLGAWALVAVVRKIVGQALECVHAVVQEEQVISNPLLTVHRK